MRGRGDRRLDRLASAEGVRAHSSTRRPSVEPGDLALLYAAGWKRIYGVAEVTEELDHDPTRARWGWRFGLRPLAVVGDLLDAPPVEAAGVLPRSLGRHSYVRLTDEQYDLGRAAIEAASGQAASRSRGCSSSHTRRASSTKARPAAEP